MNIVKGETFPIQCPICRNDVTDLAHHLSAFHSKEELAERVATAYKERLGEEGVLG
ncbi:hypothetical protein [Haloprofundus marisrubri]|uniref:hypothetical protein n=1 Tax=Haloprofundus marisrubri TaxID=1514971 RepID=UPI0012BAB1F3|nr:hypothetical protein [Haloprofundus marisrubri]